MIIPKQTAVKLLEFFTLKLAQKDLFPVIGAEIEFYLNPSKNQSPDQPIKTPDFIYDIEKEKGLNQFEVQTKLIFSSLEAAHEIERLKQDITKQAHAHNLTADFSAKPIANQPGSALHIHFNLLDKKGNNLFIKENNEEQIIMLHSIGGILANTKDTFLLYAPYEKAYTRYSGDNIQSPTKICWGNNNRSAAVRIPIDHKYDRRFEHRLACADASPYEVIAGILFSVIDGIENNILPSEKLYGNAFLEQYNYPLIPSFSEAKEQFYQSKFYQTIKELDHNQNHLVGGNE